MIIRRLASGILIAGIIAAQSAGAAYAVKERPQDTPEMKKPVTDKLNPSAAEKPKDPQMRIRIKNALDGLVKEGVITKEQEDAVIKAMSEKWEKAKKERLEKGKQPKESGKPEDRKGEPCKDEKCKEEHRQHKLKHGVLKDLVEDGTLTREQADAIRKAIKQVRDSMEKPE